MLADIIDFHHFTMAQIANLRWAEVLEMQSRIVAIAPAAAVSRG